MVTKTTKKTKSSKPTKGTKKTKASAQPERPRKKLKKLKTPVREAQQEVPEAPVIEPAAPSESAEAEATIVHVSDKPHVVEQIPMPIVEPPAAPKASARAMRIPRTRATFHLPVELSEGLKNCVVALSGPPHRLTLAALAERALYAELRRLEKEANRGKPFPQRDSDLRGGRPIGS